MVAIEKKEVELKENEEVITAVYRLNLHCNQCARAVEKPVIRTSGVQKVDIDVETGKVTVKGIFDARKMHEVIERKSKKKVEWLSPKPKEKDAKKEEKKEKIEKKEEVVKTTVIKLHLHCQKCEDDLKNNLLKLRDVYSVKMNRDAERCTIVGIVEEEKLLEYIHKKTKKCGEIISQKQEKKKIDVKEVKKEEVIEKKEELKSKDVVVPYFIHCTHAPQWFSEEDPNACVVM